MSNLCYASDPRNNNTAHTSCLREPTAHGSYVFLFAKRWKHFSLKINQRKAAHDFQAKKNI